MSVKAIWMFDEAFLRTHVSCDFRDVRNTGGLVISEMDLAGTKLHPTTEQSPTSSRA